MTDPAKFADPTAVLVAYAASWSCSAVEPHTWAAIVGAAKSRDRVREGGSDDVTASSPSLVAHQRDFEAAAANAAGVYPGPVGELVYRELRAAVDFGHRFDRIDRDALLLRLADQVLSEAHARPGALHHTPTGVCQSVPYRWSTRPAVPAAEVRPGHSPRP